MDNATEELTNTEVTLYMEVIPDGSFAIRGYRKEGDVDYCGMCTVEPREPGEYEICKWIVKPPIPIDYLPRAIKEIRKVLPFERLTCTFEKRKYPFYKRYFARYNYSIPIIKEFKKEYNGTMIDFCYVELVED